MKHTILISLFITSLCLSFPLLAQEATTQASNPQATQAGQAEESQADQVDQATTTQAGQAEETQADQVDQATPTQAEQAEKSQADQVDQATPTQAEESQADQVDQVSKPKASQATTTQADQVSKPKASKPQVDQASNPQADQADQTTTMQADQTNESQASEPTVFGPIALHDDFTIFPANKFGNTIYKNNTKILSFPNLILKEVKAIKDNYIYYGITKNDEPVLRLHADSGFNFKSLGHDFYQLSNTREYTLMLFRISPSNKIQNLLPKSKSAQGLIYNQKGIAVFFNILVANIVTKNNKKQYVYRLQLHLARDTQEEVITLPNPIETMKLKIKWNTDNSISYQDINDKTAIVEIP